MIYMHENVINQLYHGSVHVRAIMHERHARALSRRAHAHKPWYN